MSHFKCGVIKAVLYRSVYINYCFRITYSTY